MTFTGLIIFVLDGSARHQWSQTHSVPEPYEVIELEVAREDRVDQLPRNPTAKTASKKPSPLRSDRASADAETGTRPSKPVKYPADASATAKLDARSTQPSAADRSGDEPTVVDTTTKANSPDVNKKWIVQVASYRRIDNAEKLRAKLLLDFEKISIKSIKIDHRRFHRVRIGPYDKLGTAQKTRERLKTSYNLDSRIYPLDRQ